MSNFIINFSFEFLRRSLVLGEKDVMPAVDGADGTKTASGIKRNLSYPKLNLEDLNLMDA